MIKLTEGCGVPTFPFPWSLSLDLHLEILKEILFLEIQSLTIKKMLLSQGQKFCKLKETRTDLWFATAWFSSCGARSQAGGGSTAPGVASHDLDSPHQTPQIYAHNKCFNYGTIEFNYKPQLFDFREELFIAKDLT